MTPFASQIVTLAGKVPGNPGESIKLVGETSTFGVFSATYLDDISISFDGQNFALFPTSRSISWLKASEIWIRNENASANTIWVGTGEAVQTGTAGSTVTISGSVATTVVDGGNVAIGAKADAAATTDAGTFSLIGLFKRLLGKFSTLVKTVFTLNSAATTNATSVKATAGIVYSLDAINTTAAVKFIRLYSKATAPTLGTDVSFRTILVPANSSVHVEWMSGDSYPLGIGLAITNAIAYNDATAVAANDVQLALKYE